MKRARIGLGLVLVSLAAVGCAGSHHQVTDVGSGKTYYTHDLKNKGDGAVQFTDGKTGSTVTLQNSEVSEISKHTYNENTRDDH